MKDRIEEIVTFLYGEYTEDELRDYLLRSLTHVKQDCVALVEGKKKDTDDEPVAADYLGVLGKGKVEMMADLQGFGMQIAYNQACDDIIKALSE